MPIVLPSGFQITSQEPIDARITKANQAERLALSEFNVFPGLIVYQQDTQKLYVLNNTGSVGSNSGWSEISGSGGGSAYSAQFNITSIGSQDYLFNGDGFPGATADPELILVRGFEYAFVNDNAVGQHPIQIQTNAPLGGSGTPYSSGVTNNNAGGGSTLLFNVPFSAPDQLYYQCSSHPNMSGSIKVLSYSSGSGGGSGIFEQTGSFYATTNDLQITGSLNATSITSSFTGSLEGIADTGSFIPFDGNRPISNLDLSVGGQNLAIYGENMNANGLADFVDQVFFKNSPPVITTDRLRIQEFEPSASVIGSIVATDPENIPGMTFAAVGSNSNFDISSTGQVTMKVLATSALNTTQDNGNLDPGGTPRDSAVFRVKATDAGNLSTEKDIFIRITPNIAPIISQNGSGNNPISPNITESLLESSTTTPNPKFTYYSRDMDSDNLNSLSGDTVLIETGSLTPPFSDYFGLVIENNNSQNATIKVNQTVSPLDFETYPSYSFVLTSSDSHYGSGVGQDPTSITYLPVKIQLQDNASPIISDWNLGSINEKSIAGASAGNITTISDPENDVIQFVKFILVKVYHTSNPSVNLTSSYGGTSLLDPSMNPFVQPSNGTGTFTVTRGSNMFLNSDLANRYIYDCGITDYLAPGTSSANIEISIQDHGATNPTTNTAGNIIESARANDPVGGGFAVTNANGHSSPYTRIQTSNVSQNWDISVKSPGSLPTDLFEASPSATGNYVNFKLKSDLSGSGIVGGQNIVLAITASQSDFTTTKQFIEKTIAVKSMVSPAFQFQNQTSNLNTNGARPGNNLVKILITDPGQNYPIDHSTFTFSGTDLTATRDGVTDNYWVQSTTDLSNTSYTFNVSVKNDRGFAAGTDSHTITIADANNGTLNVPTANIIESAINGGDVVTAAAGFGTPAQQTQLGFSFSPPYNSPSVASITNTTAGSPIDIVGSGADIGKLSVNSNFPGNYNFGDPAITTNISFTDNYGNVGTGTFNVSVRANNPPTATFTNQTSNFNTDNAVAAADMINISSITDSQDSSTYTLALSGNDASKFALSAASVSNNGTSKVQVGTNPLTAGSYSFTVRITNPFGKFTDFARTITIAQSANYGPMYVYATNYGTSAYNTTMGYSNNPNNPGDATLSANPYPMPELVSYGIDQDAGLDSITLSVFPGPPTIQQYATVIQPDATNPSVGSALAAKNGGTISGVSGGPFRWIVLIPSGSSITQIPIDGMVNGIDGGNDPDKSSLYYYSGGLWNAIDSRINKVDFGTDSTKNKGYRYWYVIGSTSLITTGGSLQIRIVPENGTAPS